MDGKLIYLSKKLSWLLRHGAKGVNVPIFPDGFIYVEDVLKLDKFKKHTFEDIVKVVETNDKKRFILVKDDNEKWKIKACQGHSIELPSLGLVPVLSSKDAPTVIHGTTKKAWENIQSRGLNRMTRQHIHFCAGEPKSNDVVSGYRLTSDVLIYIDVDEAMKGGIKFFRSENNVILSPGDDEGYIHPKYFKDVKFIR